VSRRCFDVFKDLVLEPSGTVSGKSSPPRPHSEINCQPFLGAGVNIIVLWNTIPVDAKGAVDGRSTFLVYDLTGIDTRRRLG
jgi:hypothetical protein